MPTERDISWCPIVILVGVAGAGKNAVMEGIYARHPEFTNVDTITTRERRAQDPGRRYLPEAEFMVRAQKGEFVDWVKMHDYYYHGKLKEDFSNALKSGKRVLVEIDYRGVESYKKIYGERLGTVFILITRETQTRRYWKRWKQNNPNADAKLRQAAELELQHRQNSYLKEIVFKDSPLCDWVVENDAEGEAALRAVVDEVEKIICS